MSQRHAIVSPETWIANVRNRMNTITVSHVIPLSNFARGYDKYSARYDKSGIAQSRFPGRFFVLDWCDIKIGLDKAHDLVKRIGLEGDRVLVIMTEVDEADLHPNLATGRGRYLEGSSIEVWNLFLHDTGKDDHYIHISVEEAYAASLKVANPTLLPFEQLKPRTLSVLPIARACQAKCKFCFSEASVSVDQMPHKIPLTRIIELAQAAREAGADRFVITGGGEPGILPHDQLLNLIQIGAAHFPKTVLISNGWHLARLGRDERLDRLRDYADGGLSVLSISRHHWDDAGNAGIMGLDTRTGLVAEAMATLRGEGCPIRMRLVCVLQRGGVENPASVAAYLDYAAEHGVSEVCFKELYVSSTLESAYHERPENKWSRQNQVPLSMLVDFMRSNGFEVRDTLPWGSPVFAGTWGGRPMTVAAYTEPSLYWERTRGIARSWNIMSDASCLASLEDPASAVREREHQS